MATSLTLENDSSLAQGYIKVNGSTAATLTTSGITANLTGNVTGNATTATTATKFSTTTGSAPAYACRAWVNFDGTRDSSGAVSTANTNRLIRASGNVTSVLRNGAGDYTITFTIPMTDTSYCVNVGGGNGRSAGIGIVIGGISTSTPTQSTCRITTFNQGSLQSDFNDTSVTIFGN